MKIALVVIAVILLSGCTTMDLRLRWTKPGVAPQQLTLDHMDCRRSSAAAGSTPESYVGGVIDAVRVEIESVQRTREYDRCMTERGYALDPGSLRFF